jgi:hypothetical protein
MGQSVQMLEPWRVIRETAPGRVLILQDENIPEGNAAQTLTGIPPEGVRAWPPGTFLLPSLNFPVRIFKF